MKNQTKKVLSYLILFFGIVATLMLLLSAMAFPDSDANFTGFEIVFGTEFANLGGFVTGHIVWNILGVLAYMLPIAAGVVAVFVKKGVILSIVLFVAGAMLLLWMPDYTKTTITVGSLTSEIDVAWTLSFGLITAVVFSFAGALSSLVLVAYNTQKA